MNATLLIVDDERSTRDGLRSAFEDEFDVYTAASVKEAMAILKSEPIELLLTDLRLGGETGMDLLDQVLQLPEPPTALMMTAYGSVDTAVEAMRRGAFDFLRKPVNESDFIDRIQLALDLESGNWHQKTDREQARERIASLTDRENEVFDMVASGVANKVIASELGISERTVEVHRSQVMKKLGVRTLAQLVRMHIQFE